MELTYLQNGDFLIPNLKMDEQPEGSLTKYGLMRNKYLKENKGGIYTGLLLSSKLMSHLLELQEQAEKRMELIIEQMKQSEGVTEVLKATNQMLWIQKMSNISHSAEEIVPTEIILN